MMHGCSYQKILKALTNLENNLSNFFKTFSKLAKKYNHFKSLTKKRTESLIYQNALQVASTVLPTFEAP